MTLLNHSKAFYTINHQILCNKLLQFYNCSKQAVTLLNSYLCGRFQRVHIKDISSTFLPVQNGVPQGPLLFSLCISDLPYVLNKCKIHLYADDVQIYNSFTVQNVDVCVSEINEDLERVYQWARGNGLGINPTKSKSLVISRVLLDVSSIQNIKLNDSPIKFVHEEWNLGVVFNKNVTWSSHITSKTGKVDGMLRTLWVTQKYPPFKIRMLLAKSFLLPTLLYCCEIYANCDSSDKSKLNKLFNNMTRYIGVHGVWPS